MKKEKKNFVRRNARMQKNAIIQYLTQRKQYES